MSVSAANVSVAKTDLATGYLPTDSEPEAALPGAVTVSVGISAEGKAPDLAPPQPDQTEIRLASVYASFTKTLNVPRIPIEVAPKMEKAHGALQVFAFTRLISYAQGANPLRGAHPEELVQTFNTTRNDIGTHKASIFAAKRTIIQPGYFPPRKAYLLRTAATLIFGAGTIITLFVPPETLGITASSGGGAVAGLIIGRIASVIGTAVGPIFQAREQATVGEARESLDIAEKQLARSTSIMRALIKAERLGFNVLGKEVVQEWVRNTPGHANVRQRNKIIDLVIFSKDELFSKEAFKIALLQTIASTWKKSLAELDLYYTALTGSAEDAAKILKPLDQTICAIQFDADRNAASIDPLDKDRIAMANNPMYTYLCRLRTETKEWLRERIETVVAERSERKQREPLFHYPPEGSAAPASQSAREQTIEQRRRRTLATGGLHASGSALAVAPSPSLGGSSPRPVVATSQSAARRSSQTGGVHARNASAKRGSLALAAAAKKTGTATIAEEDALPEEPQDAAFAAAAPVKTEAGAGTVAKAATKHTAAPAKATAAQPPGHPQKVTVVVDKLSV
jgi:hypothetical protein